MKIVLMRCDTDCEVATMATATGVIYEEVKKAIGWRDLWSWLENPIYGSPWSLYFALMRLGFWKKNITLTDLLNDNAEPLKTIVLVHNPKAPTMNQHWIIWGGITDAGNHMLYWGDDIKPRLKSESELIALFKSGFPNCSFQVYKANVFKIWLEKIKILARKIGNKIKSW